MAFKQDFKRAQDKLVADIEKTIRATALELLSAIVVSTPVDTGRLRGNWQTTTVSPSTAVNDTAVDPSGSKAINSASNTLAKLKFGESIYLANNLPYAERIEMGYSDQAPSGMIRVNVARFNDILTSKTRDNLS